LGDVSYLHLYLEWSLHVNLDVVINYKTHKFHNWIIATNTKLTLSVCRILIVHWSYLLVKYIFNLFSTQYMTTI
jgi:hypothetical protein